jgi:hypothetical protein
MSLMLNNVNMARVLLNYGAIENPNRKFIITIIIIIVIISQ